MRLYVVGFLYAFDDTEVVLLRKAPKKGTPEHWLGGYLNGIGGKIEPRESPQAAMVREAKEELDLDVPWTLFAQINAPSYTLWCFKSVIDSKWALRASRNPTFMNDVGEQVEIHKVEDIAVPSYIRIVPNLRWLVPMGQSRGAFEWPIMIHMQTDRATDEVES